MKKNKNTIVMSYLKFVVKIILIFVGWRLISTFYTHIVLAPEDFPDYFYIVKFAVESAYIMLAGVILIKEIDQLFKNLF